MYPNNCLVTNIACYEHYNYMVIMVEKLGTYVAMSCVCFIVLLSYNHYTYSNGSIKQIIVH